MVVSVPSSIQLSLKTCAGQRANQNFMNGNLSPWLNSVEPANDPRIRWKQTPKRHRCLLRPTTLRSAATSPRFRSFMLPVHETVNWRMRCCGRSNARREGRVREPAEEPEQGELGKDGSGTTYGGSKAVMGMG
jgi:hypothetical protein